MNNVELLTRLAERLFRRYEEECEYGKSPEVRALYMIATEIAHTAEEYSLARSIPPLCPHGMGNSPCGQCNYVGDAQEAQPKPLSDAEIAEMRRWAYGSDYSYPTWLVAERGDKPVARRILATIDAPTLKLAQQSLCDATPPAPQADAPPLVPGAECCVGCGKVVGRGWKETPRGPLCPRCFAQADAQEKPKPTADAEPWMAERASRLP